MDQVYNTREGDVPGGQGPVFNSSLLERPEYLPDEALISGEDVERAEEILRKEGLDEADQDFTENLLVRLRFWNDQIRRHFKSNLANTRLRIGGARDMDYERRFNEQDWPSCSLEFRLRQKTGILRSLNLGIDIVVPLVQRALEGIEVTVDSISQTTRLLIGDQGIFAALEFQKGGLRGQKIPVDMYDSNRLNFRVGALEGFPEHSSMTRISTKVLTDNEVFLITSKADPEAVRKSITEFIADLMRKVDTEISRLREWDSVEHVTADRYPFVTRLDPDFVGPYGARLAESGVDLLVKPKKKDMMAFDNYGIPFKVPEVNDRNREFLDPNGLIFFERYERIYWEILNKMRGIFGNSLLSKALDNPARNEEELLDRQELFRVVEDFISSDVARVLSGFFSMITSFLERGTLTGSIMDQPFLDYAKTGFVDPLLDLDFAVALKPLLELKNPLFKALAENLLKNSEKLKAAWRGVIEKSKTETFGQTLNSKDFAFLETMYPIFDFYPFMVLAGDLKEYKKRVNPEGGAFANLEVADNISLKGVNPLIIKDKSGSLVRSEPEDPLVPLDMEIGDGSKVFVLRGPNMGGKSTVLRTIAMTKQLGQAGLPVPVSGEDAHVKMPIWGCVDKTQRQEDKPGKASTFQAQMIRLNELVAGKPDIVLMDEYGLASTEGAQYILDGIVFKLVQDGATVVIAVQDKADIARLEGLFVENDRGDALQHGHMDFEVLRGEDGSEVMKPTRKIVHGEPPARIEEMPFVIAVKLMPGMGEVVAQARARYAAKKV
ncbi:MAG: hypothetical protein AAB373_03415 [Patescibacteria group bacterium]